MADSIISLRIRIILVCFLIASTKNSFFFFFIDFGASTCQSIAWRERCIVCCVDCINCLCESLFEGHHLSICFKEYYWVRMPDALFFTRGTHGYLSDGYLHQMDCRIFYSQKSFCHFSSTVWPSNQGSQVKKTLAPFGWNKCIGILYTA